MSVSLLTCANPSTCRRWQFLVFACLALVLRGSSIAAVAPHKRPAPTESVGSSAARLASAAGSSAGTPHVEGSSEVWPDADMIRGEVKLDTLRGGTRPSKVRIGDKLYVHKEQLVGEKKNIMMEVLANELYRTANVKAADCRYYPEKAKANAFMLCRFMDGIKPVRDFTADVKDAASEHLVLDGLFASYDLGGIHNRPASHDNEVEPRGNVAWDTSQELVRVDNGGALAIDGIGQAKGTEYDCKARFLDRLWSWSPEPFQIWDLQHYTGLYNVLPQKEILKQIENVMAMKKDLLATVDRFDREFATETVKSTLESRLECLGRIAKERPDLFDAKYVTGDMRKNASIRDAAYFHELPKELCDGVRSLCPSSNIVRREVLRREPLTKEEQRQLAAGVSS